MRRQILIRIRGRDELLRVVSEKPILPGYEHSTTTQKGFTGHEMLDDLGLIHMGGRVYDPTLARFLSTDPVVQQPHNLQNYNRYSYVLNNPVSYTDPTGYLIAGLQEIVVTAAAIAGTAAVIATPSAALWYGAREVGRLAAKNKFGGELLQIAVVAGCVAAATPAATPACIALTSGWAATAVALGNGASAHEALSFGLRTAAVAYVSAHVMKGITKGTAGGGWGNGFARAYGYGFTNAWASVAMGGDPLVGFASGVLAPYAVDPITAGFVSGIASKLAGGKFEHGFMLGAISYLAADPSRNPQQGSSTGADGTNSQMPSFMSDKHVLNELSIAWTDSNPNAPSVLRGQPGSEKVEQGGWIVERGFFGRMFGKSDYKVIRVSAGTRDSITLYGKPSKGLVGWFHTHPNVSAERYTHVPSPDDINVTSWARVPGVVVTHQGYQYIPYP